MHFRVPSPRLIALTCAVGLFAATPVTASALASSERVAASVAASTAPLAPLTNLDHIDWLGDSVVPPDQAGHTTYAIDEDPELGVLWTYADRQSDGTYKQVGGGAYDAATDTWGQGAFNADDISRAAVVYLRHWTLTGSADSRERAYQLLRALTYLQTVDGPNAGNVVLWMQPDGTLNVSAEPPELPDPSDSGPSYWLARTIWALGAGYDAFAAEDADFADFLAERMDLAVAAVDRQVLDAYGTYLMIDGVEVPAWLIADGADATGEALLGLAPYVERTGDTAARDAMRELAEGVAAMQDGQRRSWPFGAILPWSLSRAFYHSWGGLAPAGLASAAAALDDDALLEPAVSDAASFTPHLLISTGPVNGWGPAPIDLTQIAYGADSRVGSLVTVAESSGKDGLLDLAGFAATWFFGNNPAGAPMYDAATGRTYDGISPTGDINFNSGAESTIHGLLAMLALDANPRAAQIASAAVDRVEVDTWQVVEAESGELSGPASVYTPASSWTGESQWSGGAGVQLEPDGELTLANPASDDALIMPVVMRDPAAGRTRWLRGGERAGVVRHDNIGAQGDSPAPGLLSVRTLRESADGDTVTVRGRDTTSLVDAMIVQPRIELLVLGGADAGTALVRSFDDADSTASVTVPGSGTATITVYTATGRVVSSDTSDDATVDVTLPRGGFALVVRTA